MCCAEHCQTSALRRDRDDNFQKAVSALVDKNESGGAGKDGKGKRKGNDKKETGQGEQSDIYKLVKMIMDRNFDPVRSQPGLALANIISY